MPFINSLKFRQNTQTAAKGVVEAAFLAAVLTAVSAAIWHGPGEVRGIAVGLAVAWIASSMSSSAILLSRAVEPDVKRLRAFWLAFASGMALRLMALAVLMVVSTLSSRVSQSALLLAYVLGVLCLLLLEYRHIKLPAVDPEKILR